MFINKNASFLLFQKLLQQTLIFLLQFRFTILTLPLLFINFKFFAIIFVSAILVDIILSLFLYVLTYKKGISSIYKDRNLFAPNEQEKINNELTEQLLTFFKKTKANQGNRLDDKEFVVIKSPNLSGQCLSYPSSVGEVIILVHNAFDEAFPRDIALLAHEYTHSVGHDLYVTQANHNYCMVGVTIIISLVTCVFTQNFWAAIWCLLYAFYVVYYINLSWLAGREQEANLVALQFVEYTYGSEAMENACFDIIKLRQLQFLNKVKFFGPLYISERNQIKFLSYFLSMEHRADIIQKVQKKAEKEYSTFPGRYEHFLQKMKFQELGSIYGDYKNALSSTFGLKMYPENSTYPILLLINIGLLWYFLYSLCLEINIVLSWWTIPISIILFVILYFTIRKTISYLWNKKTSLLQSLGI